MIIFLQQKSERCWELPSNEILPCVLEKAQGDYYAWVLAGLTALLLGIFIYFVKLYYSPEKIQKNRELLLIYKQSLKEAFDLGYFSTTLIIRNRKLKKEILFYSRLKEQEVILRQLLGKRTIGEEKVKNTDHFFRILINGLRNSSIFKDKADLLEHQLTLADKSYNNPQNESLEKSGSILQEILLKQELRVGWFIYPPFIEEDALNNEVPKGIYPLLTHEVAKKFQLKIIWKQLNLSDSVEMIKSKKIDIVVSVFQTPKRAKEVDFTAFLHSITVGGVTRKSVNNIRSQSDLFNTTYRITVAKGEIGHEFVEPINIPKSRLTIIETSNLSDIIQQLEKGITDLVLLDAVSITNYFLKNKVKSKIKQIFLKSPLAVCHNCIMIPRGQPEFAEWLDDEFRLARKSLNLYEYEKQKFEIYNKVRQTISSSY